jgi:hypothetical protein
MANLHMANIHLQICTHDIKYPLEPLLQECLERGDYIIDYLFQAMLKEDLKKVLRKTGGN